MQMYFNDNKYYVFNKKKFIKYCNKNGIKWKPFFKKFYTYDDAQWIAEYFDAHHWKYLTRRVIS